MNDDKDKYNTHGTPGANEEADTASGGAPERMDGDEPRDGDEFRDGDNKKTHSDEQPSGEDPSDA